MFMKKIEEQRVIEEVTNEIAILFVEQLKVLVGKESRKKGGKNEILRKGCTKEEVI